MPADGWPADASSGRRGRQWGRSEGARLEVAAREEADDGSAVVHATILLCHPLVPRRLHLHAPSFRLAATHEHRLRGQCEF